MNTDILFILLVAWGAITVALILLVIYRGILSTKEDDELMLSSGESHMAREQQEIILRITRLSKPIMMLSVGSGALLLTIFGIWLYRGINQSFVD